MSPLSPTQTNPARQHPTRGKEISCHKKKEKKGRRKTRRRKIKQKKVGGERRKGTGEGNKKEENKRKKEGNLFKYRVSFYSMSNITTEV